MKRVICIAFFLLSSYLVSAQNTYKVTFDHVALHVSDVDRSANFYHNVMKLTEITNRSKIAGVRWFDLGEGKELHLLSMLKSEVTLNKAVHFALHIGKFDDFLNQIKQLDIPYSDWPGEVNKITLRPDNIRQIYIQDPDGNWLEVNSI
jgi:lactoylglutathione lyase